MREDVLDDFTTIELARDAYGVVFIDERDARDRRGSTERLRAEIRASRDGLSLTTYYSSRGLSPASSPTSRAGNAEFGME